ncbi:hypothetical protein JTE90_015405 [Oedothorax gibbosus]|uniref:Disintegrin and metalloproteinase domain-containing protein 9 n=1 Tax=Oedothorax gibbosus TaxID=931172 RepID=A0AAV6U8I6_9ARAC|nr:hypothetical protein JTE90_015405 [Oedothorax gibbosus]
MCFLLFLLMLGGICDEFVATPGPGEAGLRVLFQDRANQDLITHLGTRYEVVHPVQVGQEWGRRLSTRTSPEASSHLQQTSLLIETFEYKLHLDLELNTNLFPPTLVQFVYEKEGSPYSIQELPENCYYHAKMKNYPTGRAAFYTCNGIRGIIVLENKVFLLHPLRGNHSDSPPHLLYHLSSDEILNCGNVNEAIGTLENIMQINHEENVIQRNKYIELALVVDQNLFEKFKLPLKDVVASTIEIVNYADLLFRPLNTYISVVYVEIWSENQVDMQHDISETLKRFQIYSERRMKRISIDSAQLLSGLRFSHNKKGKANLDTICTINAVGVTSVSDVFKRHVTSIALAHSIGHNLGMTHDKTDCDCSESPGCIMANEAPYFSSSIFSSCSIMEYHKTLNRGYGACLFNMPTMRKSICGNSVLEESEECDCGPPEECMTRDPCCDPLTCKLITHAQCSSGPCCKKCKLLSSDHLCRRSKGECDIPEFCSGKDGQCPEDLYKRNGAICSGGLGYCFQGSCPLLKSQCQNIWGDDSDSANSACFEKLNVLGTPNGNCGLDSRGDIHKCEIQDSFCGTLQCSDGDKAPVSKDDLPADFVIYRMNAKGVVHECKARTFSSEDFEQGLVKDGTKCGYQKFCSNQTCTSIKSLVSGKCPLEEFQSTCSGHGVCTNLNSCSCEEGWRGIDCSVMDEERNGDDYYNSREDSVLGENEFQLNLKLGITVLAASIILGLGLLVIVVLFIFYRNLKTAKTSIAKI